MADLSSTEELIRHIIQKNWKHSGSALKQRYIDRLIAQEISCGEMRFEQIYNMVSAVAEKIVDCKDMRSVNVRIICTAIFSCSARLNKDVKVVLDELQETMTEVCAFFTDTTVTKLSVLTYGIIM